MAGSSLLFQKWYLSCKVLFLVSAFFIAIALMQSSNSSASAMANSYTFGNNQALDQASVSVVRLVASYTATTSGCASTVIGLGVFVGSWPSTSGSSDFINTVMTDGSLVNPNGVSCGTGKPTATLSSVQIYANDAYTNSNPSNALLKTVQCQPTGVCTTTSASGTSSASFVCQDSAPCSNGVVLISFHTASPQPFIDMATADQTNPAPFGIGLAGPTSLTGATPSPAQATQLLTPTQVTNTTDLKNEQGMPIVNDLGQFLDMNTKAVDTGATIRQYVKTQLTPLQNGHTNSLHDSWNNGIADYYKGDYTKAQAAFRNAGTHNNAFRAGVAFWQLATNKANANTLGGNGRTPTAGRTPTSTTGIKVLGVTIPDTIFTLLLTGLLVLLVIILAFVVFGIIRKQMRQRRELGRLERLAVAEAERIKREEKEEYLRPQQKRGQSPVKVNGMERAGTSAAQPVQPVQFSQVAQAPQIRSVPDLRCPNCGAPVNRNDDFCQQCHAPLVISDSGLIVRLGKRPTPPPPASPPLSSVSPQPITHTNPVVNVAPETHVQPHERIECPRCHQSVPAKAAFCASCGFSLAPAASFQTQAMAMPTGNVDAILSPSLDAVQPQREPVREQVQKNEQNNDQQEEEKSSERLGQRLGNYQLIRLLGEGGFAEVYLGEHIHLGSQAAIKVLHGQLTRNEREKFLAEARTLVRLVHPHIVRVLDFGIEDKTPFLVMDVALDGTLRQRHPKGTRLSLMTVNSYVRQVADALQFAHDQKIIHRDVKPENMLIGRQNTIMLSDFGIATAALSSRYQNVRDMAGTITYMAPEQIQTHPRPASDQYALGIVVYEWLCGTRPFQGSFTEIAVKHATVPPPPLKKHVPTLPDAVEAVVLKALAKEPKDRFVNVQAFAQALAQAR